MIRAASTAAALFGLALAVSGCGQPADEPFEVVTSEQMLRGRVSEAPAMPRFAPDALGQLACGLVVLSVALGEDGSVLRAEVIEAPSAKLGEQIRNAFSRWRFRPFQDERSFVMTGKFSFYLIKEATQVRTVNPDDLGFIGNCNRPSTI